MSISSPDIVGGVQRAMMVSARIPNAAGAVVAVDLGRICNGTRDSEFNNVKLVILD